MITDSLGGKIMTKDEAIQKAHDMYVYEISQQTDQQSGDFDDLWQSLYDICQLATYGIIDDLVEEEVNEAMEWLRVTQHMTKNYQNTEIYF